MAVELFEPHISARAMGLGGAYSALVEDDESLWYNPAGLAKNSGFYWTIADPHAGVSNANALTSLSDLQSATTFQSTLDGLYGEPIWIGLGGKTSFQMPFFAASYFYDVDTSIIVDNPVSPTLTTNFVTDQGYALGTGWSVGGILQMGFAAKYITRTGLRKDWGTQTIADISSGNSTPSVIFDTIADTTGTGYALDYGMNITFPSPIQPTLSFVWKNMGNTKFRVDQGATAPPTEMQNMTLGGALLVDLFFVHVAPTVEFRHIDDTDIQLGKKLHLGLEVGVPFMDFRVGLYQGYYTLGFGLDLGILKIDAATWGTELGGYPGQFEDRRYMVQAILKIGFDIGGGGSGGGGSSGGKSKSSSSFFKPKKPKQRR